MSGHDFAAAAENRRPLLRGKAMTKESTIKPFEKGDIFAGATVLNDPEDDHAGDGRIIQYDADLNEKGVLWTEGTTHLVGGLKFDQDGTLWAHDGQNFLVVRVGPDGKQLPKIDFPVRALSSVNFLSDGNVLFGEHVVGSEVKLPPGRELGTKIPFMPGTEKFGEGNLIKCSRDGELIKEFETETTGGMGGFLGVTGSTLAPDGKTVVYMSELGNRLMRYDIEADKQLPDLKTYTPESGDMAMCAVYNPDGKLYYITANFRAGFKLQQLEEDGTVAQEWDMPGPGWAAMAPSIDPNYVLLGNFFSGTVAKFNLQSGEMEAKAETGVERALAGLAQYPG